MSDETNRPQSNHSIRDVTHSRNKKGVTRVSNGSAGHVGDSRSMSSLSRYDMVERILTSVLDRARGSSFQTTFGGKRDYNDALGRPDTLRYCDYLSLYERDGIAETVIEYYPKKIWGQEFRVFDSSEEETTHFIEAWKALDDKLNIGSCILRADILRSLGRYSVLLIGAPGDVSTPLERASIDSIAFLNSYSELAARVDSVDRDTESERFGLPEFYRISIDDGTELEVGSGSLSTGGSRGTTLKDKKVHYTRVVHVVSGAINGRIYGKPELRASFNAFDDLRKITGGGSEAAWQNMDPGRQIDVDPDVIFQDNEEKELDEQLEKFHHKAIKDLKTRGVTVKSLGGKVTNFGPNADTLLDFIAGKHRISKRVLLGSERGELASTQDRDNVEDERQSIIQSFAVPLVRSLVDRLIDIRALPQPAGSSYKVEWPKTSKPDPSESAQAAKDIADANAKQAAANGTIIMTSEQIRRKFFDMDTENPEGLKVERLVTATASLRSNNEHRGLSLTSDDEPDQPDWKRLHKAADSLWPEAAARVAAIFDAHKDSIDISDLESSIASGESKVVEVVDVDGLSNRLKTEAVDTVAEAVSLGGQTVAAAATSNNSFFSLETTRLLKVKTNSGSRHLADVSIVFDSDNATAAAWAEEFAAEQVTLISQHTRDGIAALTASAARGDMTAAQAARWIRDGVGLTERSALAVENLRSRLINADPGASVQAGSLMITVPQAGASEAFIDRQTRAYAQRLLVLRSETIARTEIMRSLNEGQVELWEQAISQGLLPIDQKRVWIATTSDERTRDSHLEMDGQARGLREKFVSPAGSLIDPGEEVDCRCGQGLIPAELVS